MLAEIRSSVFRTEAISFRAGLNVVLGDENATNSIGKSTLLMIVDFGFGGNTLLKHNSDLVQELGHHDYFFSFDFEGGMYRYRRGTTEPAVVYFCNEQFEAERAYDIEEYTALLKQAYRIDLDDLSFRALVGLYSRVWGKDNLSVERPLHVVQTQPARECVDTLIKSFGRYGPIRDLSVQLAEADQKSKAFQAAARHQIVPAVGRREYTTNQSRIAELEGELDDIKANLAKYATNLSEVVNQEVLELKVEKDNLLALRMTLASRLTRIQRNLAEKRHIQSKHFADLVNFIPHVDQERLAKIEEFHSGVARLLRTELKESEGSLTQQLGTIDDAIRRIDNQMAEVLGSVNEPSALVDHVYRVATDLQEIRDKNLLFDNRERVEHGIKGLKLALTEEKTRVLAIVENVVNDGLHRIMMAIFGPERKSPSLTLREKSYNFEVSDDTGTGTAYSSLIVLDLTVFLATQLPLIAHDSLLFKNIENDSVARLLRVYLQTEKQSFVALDEIEKYGPETAALLRERSAIELDNDHVLYIKDWRR